MSLVTYLRLLARDDEGQDLLEYALLVALIALVCVAAITSAGRAVSLATPLAATASLSTSSKGSGGIPRTILPNIWMKRR